MLFRSKKRIASPGSMQDTGSLGLVHLDDPEGWYGEGGGRGVQDGEHVYTRGGCMLMYGKIIQYCKVKHSSILAWRIPGMGSLVSCCLWGCTESDTTEAI